MNEITNRLSDEVSDADLEYVERLLFYEFNDALEKKQNGMDVTDEIMQLERAMESVTKVRKALQENRTQRTEDTVGRLEDSVDEFVAN